MRTFDSMVRLIRFCDKMQKSFLVARARVWHESTEFSKVTFNLYHCTQVEFSASLMGGIPSLSKVNGTLPWVEVLQFRPEFKLHIGYSLTPAQQRRFNSRRAAYSHRISEIQTTLNSISKSAFKADGNQNASICLQSYCKQKVYTSLLNWETTQKFKENIGRKKPNPHTH